MLTDDDAMTRVLDAAISLCSQNGSAAIDQVAGATGLDAVLAGEMLLAHARRGLLLVRPGGMFARPLTRCIRLPGDSHPTGLRRLTPADLMRARG